MIVEFGGSTPLWAGPSATSATPREIQVRNAWRECAERRPELTYLAGVLDELIGLIHRPANWVSQCTLEDRKNKIKTRTGKRIWSERKSKLQFASNGTGSFP